MKAPARIALVTGAASGIGAAICRRLADPGLSLILHTRENREGAERVAEEVLDAGASVDVFLGDLAESGVAEGLVAAARDRFGGLDVLISNAGAADSRPLGELDEEGFVRSFQIHTAAFFRLATAALPLLEKSAQGRVVAISSVSAHQNRPGLIHLPASGSAKAGLESLTRSLAAQLAPCGVTVNGVSPGFIRKDPGAHSALDEEGWRRVLSAIPMGRLGLPDEIAATVDFLLSGEAGYITGQILHVTGGIDL